MIEIALLEFARAGSFGPVTLGLDRERIRGLLASPDDWSAPDRTDRNAAIWKYGTTEFHFEEHVLRLIHSDTFGVPDGGGRLDLDPWVLQRGLALPDLESAMTAEAIPCRREPYPYEPGAVVLRSAESVHFLFVSADNSRTPQLSAFWSSANVRAT